VTTTVSPGVTAEEGLAAVELAERVTNTIREQDWGKALLTPQ
jgi:hypothetical protein